VSKPTEEGEAFTELVLEVFRLNGLLLQAGDRLTEPVGLSSARWQVLGVVEHGPAPVANVARIMGLTRQGVQQTADALARDGFVEYLENPHHRRAKLIALTPRGRKALDHVVESHAEWANRIAPSVNLQRLRAAVNALRQVRERLEQDAASPPELEP
jgi:DNA-binding MarR family transcriptional regulator